jgi:predicted XRE-type DNA-binding protein
VKPVEWIGGSKRDLLANSPDVLGAVGRELERVQRGADPIDWKAMASVGRGVREVRVHVNGERRVFYVAMFPEAVRPARVREEDAQDLAARPRARPGTVSIDAERKADAMKKRRLVEIETTDSVFFDLFERGKAERLSIQTGLALALEREIKARKLTQAAAARALGVAQPRVNDLLRGRLDRFSIDALIEYLSRLGVQVRIATSTPKRRGRAA